MGTEEKGREEEVVEMVEVVEGKEREKAQGGGIMGKGRRKIRVRG